MIRAVFFDVDFTLIYPGPRFQGEGYREFCARHGMRVDATRFDAAVRAASSVLDEVQEHVYDPAIFVRYTGRIIEAMGGRGPAVEACAREMYDEWAGCQHFFLYDDVEAALQSLTEGGLRIGLISNSHRSLADFARHFGFRDICAALSSAEHGYLKPHPSIFEAALAQAGVAASEAVMVGDSVAHDIAGARAAGMRGILVHRSETPLPADLDVPVVRSLRELSALLGRT